MYLLYGLRTLASTTDAPWFQAQHYFDSLSSYQYEWGLGILWSLEMEKGWDSELAQMIHSNVASLAFDLPWSLFFAAKSSLARSAHSVWLGWLVGIEDGDVAGGLARSSAHSVWLWLVGWNGEDVTWSTG
jgi:hypothetical protein